MRLTSCNRLSAIMLLQSYYTPSAASAVYCASTTMQIDSSFWPSWTLPAAGVLPFLMAAIRITIVDMGKHPMVSALRD